MHYYIHETGISTAPVGHFDDKTLVIQFPKTLKEMPTEKGANSYKIKVAKIQYTWYHVLLHKCFFLLLILHTTITFK